MAACCDVAAAATCACLAPSTGVTYGDICPVTGRPAACDRRTPRPFPDTMSDLKIFFIKFKYFCRYSWFPLIFSTFQKYAVFLGF